MQPVIYMYVDGIYHVTAPLTSKIDLQARKIHLGRECISLNTYRRCWSAFQNTTASTAGLDRQTHVVYAQN